MVIFDVGSNAITSAGSFDVTIILEREGTIKYFPGAVEILPCDTKLAIQAASSVPALDDIPVAIQLSDANGNGIVGEIVQLAVISLSDNASRECKLVRTGANGEWRGNANKLPPGSYRLEATFNGTGDLNPSSASKTLAVTNIPVTVQFTSISSEWIYPSDVLAFTVQARDEANEDQFVPLQVLSNGTVVLEGVLLPGESTVGFEWTVPRGYGTGQVNLTARINEQLSSFRGQASTIINIKSKTVIHAGFLPGVHDSFDGTHFVGEDAMLELRLLEDDGDLLGDGTGLFNGTYQDYNSSLYITRWDETWSCRDTNASGYIPGGFAVHHSPVAGNASSETRWIEVTYAGDAYHDPCTTTVQFTARKRPVAITFTNMTRDADEGRPDSIFHRSDNITITGNATDVVNDTRGSGWNLAGLAILLLVDGVVAGNCTIDALNEFSCTFSLADILNPATWQAGYHEVRAVVVGTETFAPSTHVQPEVLQVMEYFTVAVDARDGQLGWLGAKLYYSFRVEDEDGSVQRDVWARVKVSRINVGEYTCSEEEIEQRWSKGGSFEMPVSERGWYAVEVAAGNEWWKGTAAGLEPSVTWEELEARENETGDVLSTPAHLLVNTPGESTTRDAGHLSEINLKVICLPPLLAAYAIALVKTANNFKARLAIRAITYVIWWVLQDEVYLTDLIKGLIAMLLAAMWQWVLDKVVGKLLEKLPGLADVVEKGVDAIGNAGVKFFDFFKGLGTRLEENRQMEKIKDDDGNHLGGRIEKGAGYWRKEPGTDEMVFVKPGDGTTTGGTPGTTVTGGNIGQGGQQDDHAGEHLEPFTEDGEEIGGGEWVQDEPGSTSQGQANVQGSGDGSVQATVMEEPEVDAEVKELVGTQGAASSQGAQKDLGKITNAITFLQLGLLALGSLFTAWDDELERGPKKGLDYQIQAVLCGMLLSATLNTFVSLAMIMGIMEKIGMPEGAVSAALTLIFAMVAGMLLGSVIVEVLRWVIETCIIKAPISTLPTWLRFFVDMLLEMLRWTITLVFTYFVLQSGTSVAMSAIVTAVREMLVSMIKEMIKEVVFMLLMSAAGAVIDGLVQHIGDAISPESANTPDLDHRCLECEHTGICWKYSAKIWKRIGYSATDVYYIMHSKNWVHLWKWIEFVLLRYQSDLNFNTRFGGPMDYVGIMETIQALISEGPSKALSKLYGTLCAMLHMICTGFELLYVDLPFTPIYDDSNALTLDPNKIISHYSQGNIGPDIIAKKTNGDYVICEAKGLSSSNTTSRKTLQWNGTFSKILKGGTYWQCSREWLGNMSGRRNDYIGALNRTYNEAYRVCEDIRKNNAPYDVYYVIGFMGGGPLKIKGIGDQNQGVDDIKYGLHNYGEFVVALYELQYGPYTYPSTSPDETGEEPRSIVFDRDPELKQYLN